MLTPYDWQEGIATRSSFVETKLKQGSPVLAKSIEAGILVFTMRRGGRKLFEVYDRLLFCGMGQQSDVEALRTATVDFAHQEGYQRSESDVTIQRIVSAISQPIKRAFSDFNSSPFVFRGLFAEVGATTAVDRFAILDFDGDYEYSRQSAVLAGDSEATSNLADLVSGLDSNLAPSETAEKLKAIWLQSQADGFEETGWSPEAVLLRRDSVREDRFQWLFNQEE